MNAKKKKKMFYDKIYKVYDFQGGQEFNNYVSLSY